MPGAQISFPNLELVNQRMEKTDKKVCFFCKYLKISHTHALIEALNTSKLTEVIHNSRRYTLSSSVSDSFSNAIGIAINAAL